MKLEDIIRAIDDGDFDDDLESNGRTMWKAVNERLKLTRAETDATAMLSIKVGDMVQFNERVSPKYLRGVKAKVTGKKNTRLIVEVEDSPIFARKYSGMSGLRVPSGLVEKVEYHR